MAQETTMSVGGPFGSERVAVPEVTDPAAKAANSVDGARVPLNDDTVRTQPGFAEARAARDARALQPDSSVLEGIGAAVNSWDTTRLVKRLMRPSFDGEDKINQMEYLQGIPMALTEDEREYFLEVGKGAQSAQYAIEQIKDRRMSMDVLGDHPIAGFAAAMADPLWLAVPPAIRLGKVSPVAGRAVSATFGAATAGTITTLGEGPVSDAEIGLSMLMNGAAAAALYRPGKGLVQADPDFPTARLNEAVEAATGGTAAASKPRLKLVEAARYEDVDIPAKPARLDWVKVGEDPNTGKPLMRREVVQVAEPARTERRLVSPAKYEELPPELRPGAVNDDPVRVDAAVERALAQDDKVHGIGRTLQWNIHKTMSSYGPVGKKVANLLFDNNSNLSINSLESQREAILDGLRQKQFDYEDLMRAAMAEDGYGTLRMMNPFTSRDAYNVQTRIEKEVQRELFRREQYTRLGLPIDSAGVPERIARMADALDDMHKQALRELKAAGVNGAEDVLERPGYLNRKWSSHAIDQALDKLEAKGLTREAATAKVHSLVALALRRANPSFGRELSDQIGQAIVDRALRKGYFEDALFNAPAGEGTLKQLRDVLSGSGMSKANVERALDVLRVSNDEASKAGYMKHRMDLDYRATLRVGNEEISVMDLIDSRVGTIVDQYNRNVSTSAAFARLGFKSRTDVDNLRTELLHSLGPEHRQEAQALFDNSIAYLRGEPSGAALNENFRLLQNFGRATTLAWSGLWQVTEYANAMAEYGLKKSLKYGLQELPGFRQILQPSKSEARTLSTVLADHSANSQRMRPYLARYEDGFDMDTGSAMKLSLQTVGQAVPFANAMKYVHHMQARAVGNLILDRVEQAAKGNKAAREALGKYGIESHVMDKLGQEIQKHGFRVDDWDDGVWAATRPAFAKMMDAAVLKGRLGDMPAFALFDPVGKFIFTYRTFVLVAHNKLLAGGLERNGVGATGLVMMYQFPLALAAVQAQNVMTGKGLLSDDDLVKKGIGQMGGLGLLSEPFKWVTGQSNSIGAPGLIPIDRGVKLLQSTASGDWGKAGSAALALFPLANANPVFNGMAQQLKE